MIHEQRPIFIHIYLVEALTGFCFTGRLLGVADRLAPALLHNKKKALVQD